MKPQLMRSELTRNVYIVTALNADGSACTKYDVTDQFHATAKALGIGGIGQQEGVTVSRDVAARFVHLADSIRRFTYREWLDRHGHLTFKCDTADRHAFEEAGVTYADIFALAAALSATQPPTEEGK